MTRSSVEIRKAWDGHREFRAAMRIKEFETRSGGQMVVTGHAAVFDSHSDPIFGLFVERIQRGAFTEVLASADLDVRFLLNHDGIALARTKSGTLDLAETPRGLEYVARMGNLQSAKDLYAACERGDMDDSSFAFRIAPGGATWTEEAVDIDGTAYDLRTITKVGGLYDVSAVTYPAYPDADVGVARGLATPSEDASDDATRHTSTTQRNDPGSGQQQIESGDDMDRPVDVSAVQREHALRLLRFRSTHSNVSFPGADRRTA